MFYVANGNEEGVIKLVNKPDDKGLVGNVDFEGNLPVLGGFKLQVTTGPKTNRPPELGAPEAWAERPLSRTMYVSVQLPSEHVWRAKGKNHSTVSPSHTNQPTFLKTRGFVLKVKREHLVLAEEVRCQRPSASVADFCYPTWIRAGEYPFGPEGL